MVGAQWAVNRITLRPWRSGNSSITCWSTRPLVRLASRPATPGSTKRPTTSARAVAGCDVVFHIAAVYDFGEIAGAMAIGVGTSIETSAVAAGTVLSVAGEVVALIPTEVGRALMHHEQLSD